MPGPAAQVSARQISNSFGEGHAMLSPHLQAQSPVLRGHFHHGLVRAGISLHSGDAVDLHDLTSQMCATPGLSLIVVLDGAPDMRYGHRHLALRGSTGRAAGALVTLTECELSVRRARRGAHTRKVSLGFEPDWLEGLAASARSPARAFFQRHLAHAAWQPSARATALAEQLVRLPALEPLLLQLYQESRALELLGEALGTLGVTTPPPASLRPREHARLLRFREFLDSEESRGLTLDQMARQAAVNANTLQRQFRLCFGSSIFDHLRAVRLAQAREALEREGVSVAQAAAVAGYTSAANFATAFKRRYGVSPSALRARIA